MGYCFVVKESATTINAYDTILACNTWLLGGLPIQWLAGAQFG